MPLGLSDRGVATGMLALAEARFGVSDPARLLSPGRPWAKMSTAWFRAIIWYFSIKLSTFDGTYSNQQELHYNDIFSNELNLESLKPCKNVTDLNSSRHIFQYPRCVQTDVYFDDRSTTWTSWRIFNPLRMIQLENEKLNTFWHYNEINMITKNNDVPTFWTEFSN